MLTKIEPRKTLKTRKSIVFVSLVFSVVLLANDVCPVSALQI
jgi:hypothetical protein